MVFHALELTEVVYVLSQIATNRSSFLVLYCWQIEQLSEAKLSCVSEFRFVNNKSLKDFYDFDTTYLLLCV